MNPSQTPILSIMDLCIHYGSKSIVKDFSLQLGRETVVLFGPSGCGKTSILKAILGTKIAGMKKEGQILLSGNEIEVGQGNVRIVLQGPVVPGWIRVGDLCEMGLQLLSLEKQDASAMIDDVLTAFGILELKDKYPNDLSGGQKQRVSLAIALLGKPEVLLLDEPTTFIDGANRLAIWDYIEKNIYPLNIPCLLISHDPVEAIRLGDRIVKLSSTSFVEDIINIDFPHPRAEDIEKTDQYWVYRKRLGL